jgi:D-alanyl-D-alanine endopeptidase (penicillin-binding protein 7)
VIAFTLVASLLALAGPTGLTARTALVVDVESGEVLYQRGPRGYQAIASISKLMAMRVVLKRNLDLDAETEMLKSDVEFTRGGSRSRLKTGQRYLNVDLLHAALLGSDNRAVLALGRAVGLPRAAFTAAMNQEAKALGLAMRFGDPTGISHDNQATPQALVGLLKAAADVPMLAEVAQKSTHTTRGAKGRPRITYVNTDAFAHQESRDVIVGKTGFNSSAGWCVAVMMRSAGRKLAVIVLAARSKTARFGDARRILSWLERRG